ncbi:MAG: hypothetical protein M3Q27_05160, partial [Actinomycetota bacterium]|nr:hypothetical protein [Actinomycetota bacterium]
GHAHALALEVADPCWESMSCRGLGLVAAAVDDEDTASKFLHDAPAACRRVTDAYVWIEAYGLAAQAAHALDASQPRARDLIDDLDDVASAHGMRELQAEAALLRLQARMPGALDAAKAHVAAVDNPVLRERLAQLERDQDGPGRVSRTNRTPSRARN